MPIAFSFFRFDPAAVYRKGLAHAQKANSEDRTKATQETHDYFVRSLSEAKSPDALTCAMHISDFFVQHAPQGPEADIARAALSQALQNVHPAYREAHKAVGHINYLGSLMGALTGVKDSMASLFAEGEPERWQASMQRLQDSVRYLWPLMYMEERIAIRWAQHGDLELFEAMQTQALTPAQWQIGTARTSQQAARLVDPLTDVSQEPPLTEQERAGVEDLEAVLAATGAPSLRRTLMAKLGPELGQSRAAALYAPWCRMNLAIIPGADWHALRLFQESPVGRRLHTVQAAVDAQSTPELTALIKRAGQMQAR